MNEYIELIIMLVGLFAIGHAINSVSENLYWKWVDWRASKKK